ncbi:MAG: outer membrane protein assembly factor BamA [Alphaproteobacteria bacterium]|nr:outer membrane protein assembly factor BamA [Alphaproteobacteria bacterium]
MSLNALFARVTRTASVVLILALSCAASTDAQTTAGPSPKLGAPGADATPAPPPAPPIQHIVVKGTQRIESATVLSYISLREGDPYTAQAGDRALKALFGTGLFSDVKVRWEAATGTLNVTVVESPIINQIDYEGNSKVSTKDLEKEVQLKPRMVFTRTKVQSDVQRIIEVYRRNGKFGATVDPQIIQRPQNRVDLIFSIHEGPTTGVARINFIGNKVFDDDTLREQIATEESSWWRILASNDNYDPDRLTFDREQLRRFYISHGYADFHVVSAVAELTPSRDSFYVTFTVDEGQQYHFGKIEIDSSIKELDPLALRPLIKIQTGDLYNGELIQKAIDTLTNAAGTRGYAFAEVHPRVGRDHDKRTIDLVMKIDQGPRVYVEKINVTGNTRTLDKVVRREFRLVEGDAFNRVLVDRSRTRIRSLGIFKDVDVKQSPGSQPDRVNLDVKVTEQSTGELSLGAGYSSTSSLIGQFSYTERNLFGRGQYLRTSISISELSKQFQFSFTEPYFLDRPLSAGIDLYKVLSNYKQATYQADTSAVQLRFGFPTSEFGSVALRYSFQVQTIDPYFNAPPEVLLSAGSRTTSGIGFTFGYNTLDDYVKPTRGLAFSFSQDFAGFGGSLKYLRSELQATTYKRVLWDQFVGSLAVNAGYITGYSGEKLPINEHFFKGGDTFRGFALAGIGPRDLRVAKDVGALGGDTYAIGSAELRIPDFLPEDYGISFSLFSDFGTLGHLDDKSEICGNDRVCLANVRDNLAFRASAGLSIGWKSPFGPIRVDLGMPFIKTSYDRPQIIHFTAGTGL